LRAPLTMALRLFGSVFISPDKRSSCQEIGLTILTRYITANLLDRGQMVGENIGGIN